MGVTNSITVVYQDDCDVKSQTKTSDHSL